MSNRAQITQQAARDGVPAPALERDYVLAHIIAGLGSLGDKHGLVFKGAHGAHSEIIKQIITEFVPRFAPGAEMIYAGDTGDKVGYFRKARLAEFGATVDQHGKMPDVILYFRNKSWLLLIESVTSHGPVDAKRHNELASLFKDASPSLVYVTAFPERSVMAQYLNDISLETEVWCADAPTHLIHFNGERFLGPYENNDD